jgi:hypothetical protein
MPNSKQIAVKRKHRKLNERMKKKKRDSIARANAIKQKNRERAEKAAATRARNAARNADSVGISQQPFEFL